MTRQSVSTGAGTLSPGCHSKGKGIFGAAAQASSSRTPSIRMGAAALGMSNRADSTRAGLAGAWSWGDEAEAAGTEKESATRIEARTFRGKRFMENSLRFLP